MFIKTLNSVQREAATFGDGPLLILAGAGSGKTRVLTARAGWLVTRKDVPPGNILAVTFTNKAAGEMRGRLERLIGPGSGDLWLGTFHSLGLRILRRESRLVGGAGQLTVYGDDDQLALVKEVMRDLSISDKSFAPRSILWRINQAKNENIGPGEFAAGAGDFLAERVARVYAEYDRRLRDMNCRDFGDLICEPISLFKNNPHLLEDYRRRFRYILVDEYQDTNRAQYLLTNMLASGSRNIFAVGDPDQSIYAWRGADISNILDFERDYPDATVLRLEQNYRSTKTILDAANAVICRNARRLEKNLWTENAEGATIIYEEARDEYDEARRVIRHMRRLTGGSAGGPVGLGDIAVFYRTNAQSRVFEEELIREGMPYTVVGGVRFYDRMEIRDAIAYLRLASNPDDAMSFQRVVNRPARKIGAVTVGRIKGLAAELGVSIFDALREADARGMLARTRARAFIDAFDSFKKDLGAGEGGGAGGAASGTSP
ncbi:MAG: ATP-dependent helicase [Thermodesulfobacteriota bacterium]